MQKAEDQTYGENGGLGDVEHAPDGDSEWIQLLLLQETHHLQKCSKQPVWFSMFHWWNVNSAAVNVLIARQI